MRQTKQVSFYVAETQSYVVDQQEILHLSIRKKLMSLIADHIQKKYFTQMEVAMLCDISQPRISSLIRGHVNQFSIDSLVDIAGALGLVVNMNVLYEER